MPDIINKIAHFVLLVADLIESNHISALSFAGHKLLSGSRN
jgi:hypothetical protein